MHSLQSPGSVLRWPNKLIKSVFCLSGSSTAVPAFVTFPCCPVSSVVNSSVASLNQKKTQQIRDCGLGARQVYLGHASGLRPQRRPGLIILCLFIGLHITLMIMIWLGKSEWARSMLRGGCSVMTKQWRSYTSTCLQLSNWLNFSQRFLSQGLTIRLVHSTPPVGPWAFIVTMHEVTIHVHEHIQLKHSKLHVMMYAVQENMKYSMHAEPCMHLRQCIPLA